MKPRLALLDSQALPEGEITFATPFGVVSGQQAGEVVRLTVTASPVAPLALAYAARLSGAERAVVLTRDAQVRQPTTPTDFAEFTSQPAERATTFFSQVGAGYVQQTPPFCPELRQSLLQAGAADGGNLLVLDVPPSTAVQQWATAHGFALFSTASQPEGALCRELEMCMAVLALPEGVEPLAWATAVLPHLPAVRACACGQTMAFAKQSGKLAADWRDWPLAEPIQPV